MNDEDAANLATLERLLEAHVQHELARWRPEALANTLSAHVGALFVWFTQVKLDDIVSREQIMNVIERYVIQLRVSGGITELSGEMSRLVFSSRVMAETRVDQIVAPDSYDEFADKLVALEAVRRELIALVAQSATFAGINARMLARSLLALITPGLPLDRTALLEPLAQLGERLGRRMLPPIERRTAELLGAYLDEHRDTITRAIERHLLSVLSPERIRSLLDEVWGAVAPMRLSEAFALMGEQDIEDFVVLVYEFWQRYRKTDFFRRIAGEMTDYFFRKYGQETVSSLIEDMGVDEHMVSDELTGFLRPVFERAATSGALERFLRAQLASFYRSPAALAALAG
ncbi:MAG: hypothetical protein ABW321_14075 [Polyangiales bacterium]